MRRSADIDSMGRFLPITNGVYLVICQVTPCCDFPFAINAADGDVTREWIDTALAEVL